tara:strand:- start:209 stop:559 length:351 start_codon:yes stop_codon:yes gene_type:complete
MTFEDNIRKWINLNNNIKESFQKIKHLKIEKEQCSDNILEYISENKLENATFKIGEGKLRIVEVNTPQPLTYKFMCECLCEYFNNDEELVQEILLFIKNKRNIKTNKELKSFGILN